MGPKPQKSEPPFVAILGENVGQNGFQWTRLAELVWMPRVSARDLDSEINSAKIFPKPWSLVLLLLNAVENVGTASNAQLSYLGLRWGLRPGHLKWQLALNSQVLGAQTFV